MYGWKSEQANAQEKLLEALIGAIPVERGIRAKYPIHTARSSEAACRYMKAKSTPAMLPQLLLRGVSTN